MAGVWGGSLKQMPLDLAQPNPPQLEGFFPGDNVQAVFELQTWAVRVESGASGTGSVSAGVMYLWGEQGCGKTHLLRAWGQRWRQAGRRVLELSGGSDGFWECASLNQDRPDVLVLDDAHVLSAEQQHAVFSVLVGWLGQGCAVLAAGRCPPVDLPVREDVKTRLAAGSVLAFVPLGEADTRAVLVRDAALRGLDLPKEVLDYVLVRFHRDLKSLMKLVQRLDVFALAQKRVLTVPLLKQMLLEEPIL
jgi:DnaA family protein